MPWSRRYLTPVLDKPGHNTQWISLTLLSADEERLNHGTYQAPLRHLVQMNGDVGRWDAQKRLAVYSEPKCEVVFVGTRRIRKV
jgi:hypothetical protein